jgi:hypothetical protein
MRRFAFLLCVGVSPALLAQPANPCPYTAEYLTAQLGQSFKVGVPEGGLIGKGCRYDGRDVKLWLDSGPLPAPTAAQWRKMSSPPSITWQPVPGDPDNAVFEVAKAGAEAYPTISYERKTWLVQIRVTGDIAKGFPGREAAVGAWQARLAKLQRIP